MNEFESSMIERVSRTEEMTKNHERRIQILEEKNEALITMSTILQNMKEDGDKRDQYQKEKDEQQNKQMSEFSDTLKGVNANLTELNGGYKDLNQRVGNIENSKWDWNDFMKKAFAAILISVLTYLFVYYFKIPK